MNLNQTPIVRGIQAVRAETETVSLNQLANQIDSVQRAFAQFKETNDERLKALAKSGSVDALVTEQLNRISADVTKQQAAIDEANNVLARFRAGGGGATEEDAAQAQYRTNFNAFFRRGDAENQVREFNATATRGSNPDGGYLVPTQMEGTIDRVLGTISAMRGLARVISISAPAFETLMNTGGASSGWTGETGSRTATNTPQLVKQRFEAMELYANPFTTQNLLDDAAFDIGQWLADEVSIEFAEQEGEAFITGDGVGKPRGILSYDMIANASWSYGKVGFIKSGKASTFNTDAGQNGTEKLVDVIHALKKGYRNNARWLMNNNTQSTIRQFKDANANYVWQPSIQVGQPATLLGYGVEDDDNMPDIGADAFPVAFADFQRAYNIVDKQGVRVLRDPFTNKPYVGFYTTKRVGGGIRNFQAIKVLKISA